MEAKVMKMWPQVAYIGNHRGFHVEDGIYKLEVPFHINIEQWSDDPQYDNYAVIGTNYSLDYSECDILYFTTYSYGKLNSYKINLCKNNPDYGYIQNTWNSNQPEMLGGLIFEI